MNHTAPAPAAETDAAPAMFELSQAAFAVAGRALLQPLDLTLAPHRVTGLIGHNGSGKSTLLKLLARQQAPSTGTVRFEGRPLRDWADRAFARRVAYLPQQTPPASGLLVRELVALGRYPWSGWLGTLNESDREIVRRSIEAAGIEALLERKVHTLSDGENQKVMLARALAQDTPILMLDEPTAHLDLPSRIRLMRLLHQLAREMNKGILLSTHELDLALQVADEVWLLQSAAAPHVGATLQPAAALHVGATLQPGASLHKGAPEDLVLDGTFEAAFEREDVSFDRATGVFRIHPPGNRAIRLAGSGMAAFWTRRALSREGFNVVEGYRESGGAGEDVVAWVSIEERQGRPVWGVRTQLGDRQYNSIAGLLEALNDPDLS